MKPQEAISAINHNMPTEGTYTILTEALGVAIKALEKQIPLKPDEDDCCTICHTNLKDDNGVEGQWCPNCGRKVDWGEKQ